MKSDVEQAPPLPSATAADTQPEQMRSRSANPNYQPDNGGVQFEPSLLIAAVERREAGRIFMREYGQDPAQRQGLGGVDACDLALGD